MVHTNLTRFLTGAMVATGAALALSATPASAQYTIFTDRAAWNAAVAPNTIITETFSTTGTVTAPGLTFTKGTASPATINQNAPGRLFDQAQQGNANRFVQFGFTPEVQAVGADFFLATGRAPEQSAGVGLTFTLRDGINTILVQEQIPGTTNGGFFGIVSNYSIATLRLTAGTGVTANGIESYSMDNLSFAQIDQTTVVPEPGEYAVGAMFAAGLMGLMVRARRATAKSTSLN